MKEDAGMIRIAIATLAVTMIAAPVLILCAAAPTTGPGAPPADARIPVSQDQAVALAKGQGVARVSNIVFLNDTWIVQGVARDGAHLEVDVSSAGDVLNPVS